MDKIIDINSPSYRVCSEDDLRPTGIVDLKRWLTRTQRNTAKVSFDGEQNWVSPHETEQVQHYHAAPRSVARAAKVVFDISAALAGIAVLSPLLGLIAIAVKIDGGPVFFAHTRIGRGGRKFNCLKFRSMTTNSADILAQLLKADPIAAAEWRETQKLKNDPRITAIGRLLRASSLDEIPQLINVLRLDMSLVGPRPIVADEVPRYGDNIAQYFAGRPGLTGLWQVSGRSDTSYAQRVALDTQYVSTWSIWRDFAILARTIPAVIRRRGAC